MSPIPSQQSHTRANVRKFRVIFSFLSNAIQSTAALVRIVRCFLWKFSTQSNYSCRNYSKLQSEVHTKKFVSISFVCTYKAPNEIPFWLCGPVRLKLSWRPTMWKFLSVSNNKGDFRRMKCVDRSGNWNKISLHKRTSIMKQCWLYWTLSIHKEISQKCQ